MRFWPRSRTARPKQLLAPLGGPTLLRRTFERITGLVPPDRVWVITSRDLRAAVAQELPEVPLGQIVGEPVARNTAPAVALSAALALRSDPDAVLGVFPSDHHVRDEAAYGRIARLALAAAAGNSQLIVLGIPPTRPETGYGYIEFEASPAGGSAVPVVRFREKPSVERAREFVAAGRFYWNSGQFFWQARAIGEEFQELLPKTWEIVTRIADAGSARLDRALDESYGDCAALSVDRAILERSGRVAGFSAAGIGWSDLGSWQSLYELLPKDRAANCARSAVSAVRSAGNFVDVPGRRVALLGVSDLVVVEADDALLICRREEAQSLGEVTAALAAGGHSEIL